LEYFDCLIFVAQSVHEGKTKMGRGIVIGQIKGRNGKGGKDIKETK
jgi:hypothetical protein